MRRFFVLLLLVALSGCASLSPTNPEANAKSEALLRDELARIAAPAPAAPPRLFYLGLAGHSASTAFVGDTALTEQVARKLFPDPVIVKLANPAGGDLSSPFATPSTLSRSMDAIAAATRPQDRVLILLSSHGNRGVVALNAGQQGLPPLSDKLLASELAKLGETPTIVIVSACYSGSLISALRADNRIVVTAAATDRSSFGCATDSRNTFFIEELLQQGFRPAESIRQAYQRATRQVLAREKQMGIKLASNPQIFVGKNMTQLAARPIQDWLRPIEPNAAPQQDSR